MRNRAFYLFLCLFALASLFVIGCSKTEGVIGWPPVKTRDVPAPAPLNLPNVATYTEQTYQIDVAVGQEFAIGMFEGMAGDLANDSHDSEYIELLGYTTVLYDPPSLNHYGTQWFLYKALKGGKTEILFRAPIEYNKVFSINIKA
jgi:hypothetical protein